MTDKKITEFSALAGTDIDPVNDVIPIIDVSVADALKNKKITPNDIRTSIFSGALVNKAADQNTANYTAGVAVVWDAEQYDVGGWHDTVTNNTRLTVPAGVNYVTLAGCISFSNFANATHQILFLKNGSAYVGGSFLLNDATSTATGSLSASCPAVAVVAGDYFELQFTVVTDTSITIRSNVSCFGIWAVG